MNLICTTHYSLTNQFYNFQKANGKKKNECSQKCMQKGKQMAKKEWMFTEMNVEKQANGKKKNVCLQKWMPKSFRLQFYEATAKKLFAVTIFQK